MAANTNTIEQIQIGEVACLPKNKDYLPSDSRNMTGCHSFLVKFFKKLKLLSPDQKLLYIRTLPLLPDDDALIDDDMATADDISAGNNNSIDSIVYREMDKA